MFFWFPMLTLTIEALQVIDLRLRLMATGRGTSDEMFLMVNEKIEALADARTILIRGGNPNEILDNYRKIVADGGPGEVRNALSLSAFCFHETLLLRSRQRIYGPRLCGASVR
jgi:hypothetical protein